MQACAWWNLAAVQGDKKASEYKRIINNELKHEQIAEAQKLICVLCEKISGYVK